MPMSGNVDFKMSLLDPTIMVRRLPSSLARTPPTPQHLRIHGGVVV